ncbi:hypothetical protein GYA25_01755, partial [Candidatus Woesearchaeota archaeon]|nr:hypothetical protein [Candidatus Woesearchaeota archaeon]
MLNLKIKFKISLLVGFFLCLFIFNSIFLHAEGISIGPSKVGLGDFFNISIDLSSYSKYLYIVQDENPSLQNTLSLDCLNQSNQTSYFVCKDKYSITVSSLLLGQIGNYTIWVYDYKNFKWINAKLEIVSNVNMSDNSTSTPDDTFDISPNFVNKKRMDLYKDKPIFVSVIPYPDNKDYYYYIDPYDKKEYLLPFIRVNSYYWKQFLPFVSLTNWEEDGKMISYPLFTPQNYLDVLYEGKYNFISDYNPKKIVIIESNSSLDNNLMGYELERYSYKDEKLRANIKKISISDYLFYWEKIGTVVYVQEDYPLALVASTYASLLNAPLIIENQEFDVPSTFVNRRIICVGDVSPSDGAICNESYPSLESLQDKIFQMTETDKIILVNPSDVFNSSYGVVSASLYSSILAAAKKELILPINSSNPEEIRNTLKQKILYYNPKYLTIIADFNLIPHRSSDYNLGFLESIVSSVTDLYYQSFSTNPDFKTFYLSLDQGYYGDIDGDKAPDLFVGRINGLKERDVSNYIVRDLFYDSLHPKSNNMKFLASSFYVLSVITEGFSQMFKEAGYNAVANTTSQEAAEFNPSEWENQDLIYYADHGAPRWAGIYSNFLPPLNKSLVVVAACDTASLQFDPVYLYDSFWARAISNGAIGYLGAVSTTFLSTDYTYFLDDIYRNNKSLGEAIQSSFNPSVLNLMTILIGDPTLHINPPFLIKREIKNCLPTGWWVSPVFSSLCCSGKTNWLGVCSSCLSDGTWAGVANAGSCCSGKTNWLGVCSSCLSDGTWSGVANAGSCCSGKTNWLGVCSSCLSDGTW